jgi:hypothetical protein
VSAALGPTIGGPHPGHGLRVRFPPPKAHSMASADFSCSCGKYAEDAVGYEAVEQLVIKAGRHQRDECTNPEVRAAARRHYAALQQSLNKRRRK